MSGCVLDTDVVIAVLDRQDAHHASAAAGIKTMIAAGTPRLLSLVNYAETLVRPAEDEKNLRAALDALKALGIRSVAPTPAIALDAARHRALNISLADGFALATAQALQASVASYDQRVRRAAAHLDLRMAPGFSQTLD